MKKVVSLMATLVMTAGMLLSMPFTVNAASAASNDGVEVSITTDKDSYVTDEEISIDASVKNTAADEISGASVKIQLPDGVFAKSGKLSADEVSIPAGGVYTQSVKAVKIKANSGDVVTEPTQPVVPDHPETGKITDSPKTGDDFNVWVPVALMLLSGACILIYVRKTGRTPKSAVSLMLCLTLGAAVVPFTAFAAAGDTQPQTVTVTADKVITIHEHEYTVKVTVTVPVADDDGNVTLTNFKGSQYDVRIGTDSEVLFTVKAASDKTIKSGVAMYDENNRKIAAMHDDGKNGDTKANDGIYSVKTKLDVSEMSLVDYHAVCNTVKSNTYQINFYRDITQNEFAAYSRLLDKMNSLNFAQAKAYAASSTEITDFHVNESRKTIAYNTVYHISGVWENAVNGVVKGNGELSVPAANGIDYAAARDVLTRAVVTPKHSSNKVVVLRPFRTSQFRYDDFKYAGEVLKNGLNGSLTVIDDENVTLSVMKSLSQYDIVLIDSHGGLDYYDNTFIVTGDTFDESRFLNSEAYYNAHAAFSADYNAGRICGCGANKACVYSTFFDEHYSGNSLKNSFWFLGCCYGMYNNSLSDSLIRKGAGSVMGYTNAVSVSYCNQTLFETAVNSMLLSADTADNAVTCAKNIYGAADPYSASRAVLRNRGESGFKIVDSISASTGTLSGKVCKASDRITPIADATVAIYKNNSLVKTLKTDETGHYSVKLPKGDYLIKISATGYLNFESYATVVENSTTYMETFLMIDESAATSGIAKGKVINSLIGTGADGVTLSFKERWNASASAETVGTAVTDATGNYTVELPLGNYTAVATKEGFLDASFNIVVQEGTTEDQNGTITPIVSGNSFLITLTWGLNPRDLDSHVAGTLTNGSSFHVYYRHKSQYDGNVEVCNLDYDDTTSYGPEHITLNTTTNKPYYYYIHRYAGSGSISTSSAKITVHKGNTKIAEFNVPTNLGTSDYWNVFAIVNGKLIVKNTMTASPDTAYADTRSAEAVDAATMQVTSAETTAATTEATAATTEATTAATTEATTAATTEATTAATTEATTAATTEATTAATTEATTTTTEATTTTTAATTTTTAATTTTTEAAAA